VYEDERAVAFPNRYPSLYGDVFVAPKDHREQVTRDFSSTADATTHEVPPTATSTPRLPRLVTL
jgi:diadenosine tetraphosphate (Ap4A) HIT family hydrolase